MPQPTSSGFNYLAIANNARSQPAPSQGGPGGDTLELGPMFSVETDLDTMVNPHIRKDTPPEKASVESSYQAYSKVFCIWRDWEACARCQNALASGHAILPVKDGDYECPHTQAKEYKAVMDKYLKGDCTIVSKEPFPTEGARFVHVEWMEVDPDEARRIKRLMEERKRNQIYPPNVEQAFKKD
jgi:hypothetical protein